MIVGTRTGRSSIDMFALPASLDTNPVVQREGVGPALARRMMGMSDHGSCLRRARSIACRDEETSASSVIRMKSVPSEN